MKTDEPTEPRQVSPLSLDFEYPFVLYNLIINLYLRGKASDLSRECCFMTNRTSPVQELPDLSLNDLYPLNPLAPFAVNERHSSLAPTNQIFSSSNN